MMLQNFESLSRQNTAFVLQSVREWNRGLQEIGSEMLSFASRSVEESAKAVDAMLSARSIDDAINIQRDLARRAYEDWVTALGKLSTTLVDASTDAYKPLNSALSNGFLGNLPNREEHTRH